MPGFDRKMRYALEQLVWADRSKQLARRKRTALGDLESDYGHRFSPLYTLPKLRRSEDRIGYMHEGSGR
jgi:hypothetical protein